MLQFFFVITENHTCSTESMARVNKDQYIVTGNENSVVVGDSIQVTCALEIQLLTKDIWDDNPTDNFLDIICRPDKKFDVPSANDLPDCLAQCSANKPVPPDNFNIKLDESRTPKTKKLWEREELW
jgi:hypothetical protein